ncbi:MAG TPA: hypothetical protein VGH19_22210 [Verrucomicrobiae bacterium]
MSSLNPFSGEPEDPFYELDTVENAPRATVMELLQRRNVSVAHPDELTENSLTAKLWEIIYALAANRIFFHSSDHLSDREFYAVLLEKVLPEVTSDLSHHYGTNCHFDLLEFAGEKQNYLYLKYYADQADKALWQRGTDVQDMPEHADLPYARDRYLPQPCPPNPHSGRVKADFDFSEEKIVLLGGADEEEDPLGLNDVEQEIRIHRLEQEIEDITGQKFTSLKSPNCPPDLEEAFLENVKRVESEGWIKPFDKLVAKGFKLPEAETMDDATLTAKLSELIQALGKRGFFLHNTNHLSDRELYTYLWEDGLREEIIPGGAWHLDVVGSGSEEDVQMWLRYYASEEERSKWAQEWPKDTIPVREVPKHDRDGKLPRG